MTFRARGLAAAASLTTAAMLACRAPERPPVVPAPTPTAILPTARPTVSPLPVETSPAPSIYDRTPGVMHEERGARQKRVSPTRTPLARTTRTPSRRS